MTIDSIKNGIVIDHIPAGKSMLLYQYMNLDKAECSVAILKNVTSAKLGRKDIIKIDEIIDLDWEILGYLAPDCTVNIIRNGETTEKRHLQLPEQLVGVIECKNPRCITTLEQELTQIFKLTNRQKGVYRCIYCDAQAK